MATRPLPRPRHFALAVTAAAALAAVDLTRPAADPVSARLAIASVRLYQVSLSPLLSFAGVSCRLSPTCSQYAEQVVREYGTVRGGWLTLRRLVRCGPWTANGTVDPPPAGHATP